MTTTSLKILVIGDSLLKGVVYNSISKRYQVLEHHCIERLQLENHLNIVNLSKFGLTSTKALPMLMQAFALHPDASFVVIELGGNDCDYHWNEIAKNPHDTHYSNTILSTYCDNIKQMIVESRIRGMIPILTDLPPIDSTRYFHWIAKEEEAQRNVLAWLKEVTQIERHQEMYSRALTSIAAEMNCPILSLRSPLLSLHSTSYLCDDGIHINQIGHDMMHQTAVRFLEQIQTQGGIYQ